MTTIIDFRTMPANVPVLCIPRVYPNIKEERIRRIFDELDMGTIDRIDVVSKSNEKGEKFNRVFVHYQCWNNSENANNARDRLLNGKEIKIIYDEPWFWKVSAYRESNPKQVNTHAPAYKKASIQFDSDEETPSTRGNNVNNVSIHRPPPVPRADYPRADYPRADYPRPAYDNRPSRPVYDNRPPRPVYDNRPPRPVYDNRPPRPTYDNRPPRPTYDNRPPRPAYDNRLPRPVYDNRPLPNVQKSIEVAKDVLKSIELPKEEDMIIKDELKKKEEDKIKMKELEVDYGEKKIPPRRNKSKYEPKKKELVIEEVV